MCGIVGYVGKKEAVPILVEGLAALEYRGYDSAGIVVLDKLGKPALRKSIGQVSKLKQKIDDNSQMSGSVGIGHTRWATHGAPSVANAHPHADCTKRVFVVHNGIVENYKELKSYLSKRGHDFHSETDTEVIAHLIEDFLRSSSDFSLALRDAIKMIKGAYALGVIDSQNPHTVYGVRLSSPLVVGVGQGEYYLASDPSALVGRTRNVMYLDDGDIATITADSIQVQNIAQQKTPPEIVRLEWDLEQAQKGDYPHFMLKEIFEGSDVVRAATRGRLKAREGLIKLGGLEQVTPQLKNARRIIILGCGTSYYAGLVGEYLFEELAGVPVEVQYASEFRYRTEPFDAGTVAIAISQSGETADTLAALRKAKENGLLTLGIVNTVGSTIARETDAGVYNHAGPEIGVASTKAFISQLTILTLMALYLPQIKGQNVDKKTIKELADIPGKMQQILDKSADLKRLAKKYQTRDNFLFLGRRYNFPVALEGALKLKEISYIHAEGYGAGEMKHGPIAMISKDFPVLAIAPKNSIAEKMLSNLEESKARHSPVVAIGTQGDTQIASLADDVFYVPPTLEPLEPLLSVIPLQLFAYYVGVGRGYDVDRPRNLAKSVTVE